MTKKKKKRHELDPWIVVDGEDIYLNFSKGRASVAFLLIGLFVLGLGTGAWLSHSVANAHAKAQYNEWVAEECPDPWDMYQNINMGEVQEIKSTLNNMS